VRGAVRGKVAAGFIDQGEHAQMLADCGLDAAGLVAAINKAGSET